MLLTARGFNLIKINNHLIKIFPLRRTVKVFDLKVSRILDYINDSKAT